MKAELLFAKCQFSHSAEPFLKLVNHKSVVISPPSDQSYIEHVAGFQQLCFYAEVPFAVPSILHKMADRHNLYI